MEKKNAKTQQKRCEHKNTYPIAFFDEQDFTDWAYLVIECEDCGGKMVLVGKHFVTE